MDNRSFDTKSKLSLDDILSDIVGVEKDSGDKPEKLWSLSDINALLEETAPEPQRSEPAASAVFEPEKISEPENIYEPKVELEPIVEVEPEIELTAEFKPEPEPEPEPEFKLEPEQVFGIFDEIQASPEEKPEPEFTPLSYIDDADEAQYEPEENELLKAPPARYFADGQSPEPEEESVSMPRLPGIFDGDADIFAKPAPVPEITPEQAQEYKDRFKNTLEVEATRELVTDDEPIEKPGMIVRRSEFSDATADLEPLPKVIPAEDFLGENTKVIGQPAFIDPLLPEPPQEEQLILSGFADSDEETQQISEDELSAEVYMKRHEKKKNFVLIAHADGEEGSAAPDDEPSPTPETEDEEESGKTEYERPEQRGAVLASLKAELARSRIAVIGLAAIDMLCLIFFFVPKIFELLSLDAPAFSVGGIGVALVNILLTAAAAVVALPIVTNGLKSLFSGHLSCDTVGVIYLFITLAQAIAVIFDKEPLGAARYFYSCSAVFALLLLSIGKCCNLRRTVDNFKFCAFKSGSSLYGIRAIESEKEAFEVGRSLRMGNPDILYSGKILFPTDFVANSKDSSTADKFTLRGLILSLCVCVVAAVIGGVLSKDAFQGISIFTGVFGLSAPVSILLSLALPLMSENRSLNASGAMITGYPAAAECASTVAVAVDCADLFDRSGCCLHGMKDYKNVRLDEVLLYATAIVLKSGGPLSDVFNGIIGGATELLPTVKDLLYEDRLGLSATIYGQKVLLGNRNMLVHHNIDVPLKSEEDKYKHSGRKVLYLAIDEKVAALFVVSYAEDGSLSPYLQKLEDSGIQLVVRTDDPNITDELLASRFGIAVKNVKLTLSPGARIFRRYRDSVVDSKPAAVLHDGSAYSYFKSVSAASRLAGYASRFSLFSLNSQAIIAVGALVCVCFSAFAFISPVAAIIVQSLFTLLNVVFEKFRK